MAILLIKKSGVIAMYLMVRNNAGEWVQKQIEQAAAVETDEKRRLYVYGMDGEKCMLPDTLEDAESLLEPLGFFRANKRTLINIDGLESVSNPDLRIGNYHTTLSRRNFFLLSKMLGGKNPSP
jgi:DNA-binding LytR/AlgR family response regulator